MYKEYFMFCVFFLKKYFFSEFPYLLSTLHNMTGHHQKAARESIHSFTIHSNRKSTTLILYDCKVSLDNSTDINPINLNPINTCFIHSMNEGIIYIYITGIFCGYFSTSLTALGRFMGQMLMMQYGIVAKQSPTN